MSTHHKTHIATLYSMQKKHTPHTQRTNNTNHNTHFLKYFAGDRDCETESELPERDVDAMMMMRCCIRCLVSDAFVQHLRQDVGCGNERQHKGLNKTPKGLTTTKRLILNQDRAYVLLGSVLLVAN